MSDEPRPRIGSPCPKSWPELTGGDRRRFCAECGLHVHNLDAFTPGERREFLGLPGRKCGAYAATPAALPRRGWRDLGRRFADRRRFPRIAVTALSIGLALIGGGCATASRKDAPGPPPVEQGTAKDGSEGKEYKMIVGVVCEPERPLWQRILWPWGG